jgi:DNA-binding PadR family transcriptional regulator
MNGTKGPNGGATALAVERRRVLDALRAGRGEALTGPAINLRIGGSSTTHLTTADEHLLYPALHSLEADWRLEAMWLADAGGRRRRVYRRRRLLARSGWI